MKIFEIIEAVETYAPTELAEDFDNVGLLIGDGNRDVGDVLLTLDVDIEVAKEAKKLGAGLIISHHPVIFEPLKQINTSTPSGRLIMYLIENKISVYSAHTNLDTAAGGLNDLLAALIKLENTSPLLPLENGMGLGRVGTLPAKMTVAELAEKLKQLFGIPAVRFTGDASDMVERVALCSGGGGSLVDAAVKSGAQVYISGDIKYNAARDALCEGMRIIEIGHYESEILAADLFSKIISDSLGDGVRTHITKANTNVFGNFL